MNIFEKIDKLLQQNNGIFRTSQVMEAKISKPVFYTYVREHKLEQVAHGVYISPDSWTDAMYLLHLRCAQAVFSHETALFLHDLTDREPMVYSITVKTGYNPTRLHGDGFKVYTIKRELYEIGIINAETHFGHTVPVYDMERTVCNLLRSRSNIYVRYFYMEIC